MHHGIRVSDRRSGRRTKLVVPVTVGLMLGLAATALGALPTANGQYAGRTSAAKIGGFSAPVAFTASSNRRHVLDFNYGTFACFNTYTKGTNPYSSGTLVVVRAIRVSSSGHFAIAGSKDSVSYNTAGHPTITTTTKLSGKFTSATHASGTITFTRTYRALHGNAAVCGSGTVTFRANFTHAG